MMMIITSSSSDVMNILYNTSHEVINFSPFNI